jgi:ketosteroid isomerase-like protein
LQSGRCSFTEGPSDLVRRYYEFVDAGNFEEVFKLFHPDIVYERGGTRTMHGIDELKKFYHSDRVIQTGRHEIQTLLTEASWVVVRGVFNGILKSGEKVEVRFADFHEFSENKIRRRYSYFMDRSV